MIDKLLDISCLLNSKVPKRHKKTLSRKSKNTAPERKVQKILQELGIKYVTQKEVGGKFYDIFIPSKNLLIEVDGDYWHGKDIEFTERNEIQRKAFINDITKDGIATLYGYKIIRIWESEITKDRLKKLIYG